MKTSPSIAFICPYPFNEVGSQRFRFEQYFPDLKGKGIYYKQFPLWNEKNWSKFKNRGQGLQVLILILIGFYNRLSQLPQIYRYDYLFIHREMFPVGPPAFEWVITHLFPGKVIYDFDDAIWLNDPSEKKGIRSWIRGKYKVPYIIEWSNIISCGNEFLKNYASQFNSNAILNPTTINTEYHLKLPDTKPNKKIYIGWTGTYTTLLYLQQLEPVLKKIESEYDVGFLVIADKKPNTSLENFIFLPWERESEIEDLNRIDIGLMPLSDDDWSRGKCGFKLLQYMACEIPCLASPVGVNGEIIDQGKNGYLCRNDSDWYEKLKFLIENENIRMELGVNGRKKVVEKYSVVSNTDNFLGLFDL